MADIYVIYGFYEGKGGPVLMEEFTGYEEANRWRQGYTAYGNWGGYDCLALYEVAPYESTHTIHLIDSPVTTWHRESGL